MRLASASTSLVHKVMREYPARRAKRSTSSTSRPPMPRPLAHGSTSSSLSRAVVASSRTQNTQPAGAPSTSAIQAASASGSRFST